MKMGCVYSKSAQSWQARLLSQPHGRNSGSRPNTDRESLLTENTAGLAAAGLCSDPETDRDQLSWLVVGATPERFATELLGVERYTRYDAETLAVPLPDIDATSDIVSFDTDAGLAVEIRMPVEPSQVTEATAALAERNATVGFDLNFVVDINDADEEFVIQAVEGGGRLNQPRRIKLVF